MKESNDDRFKAALHESTFRVLFRVISWIDFGGVLKDDPRIITN
jgi:hypothetical protein